MGSHRRWMIVALGAALAAPAIAAESPIDLEAVRLSKRVAAVRVDQPIVVDGILDEPDWELAQPATDFFQQEPEEYEPARLRTEVRFLYDNDYLYVGAMLYDDAPEALITNDLKRDFSGRDGDLFGVIVDTFGDVQEFYGFLTNPGGAQRDTQGYDNGRRHDQEWDGVWFVRTSIRPDGWSVELAIPFRTLRFPDRGAQQWGLNLVRLSRRRNEMSTWAPVPRQFEYYNVAYAGSLTGIDRVAPGRNLRVKPFATARVGEARAAGAPSDRPGDGGVDVKWGITPSLMLDATYRTDFSQVEADEQQINLTRFSLFFPEKRDFFLESPASFQIGLVGSGSSPRRDLLPFFSRRIGLSADGQPVPVVGGARLTGRAGRQRVGMLTMQTEPYGDLPGQNFTALRLTRQMSDTVGVGAFYFGREEVGDRGFNRVAGLDLRIAPRRTMEIEAFAMRSTAAAQPTDWAGRAGVRIDTNAHRAYAGLLHIGDSFQHDLGFVRRRGVGMLLGQYTRLFRPADPSARVREQSIGLDIEAAADDGYGRWLTRIAGVTYGLFLADGSQVTATLQSTYERVDRGFGIGSSLTIGPGEYRFHGFEGNYLSNKSARLSGSLDVQAGQFWTGRRTGATVGLRARMNAHLAASATLGHSDVDLPEGSFAASLAGLRLDWSLSPRMFLNAFVQYNGEADLWLSNVRFNLVHRPLSDIYVVWNEVRLAGDTRRVLMLKYTQLFSF